MHHFPFPAKRASEESERTSLVLNGSCKAEAVTDISQPPPFPVELLYSSTEFIFTVTQQHIGTWTHTQGSPHPRGNATTSGREITVKPHSVLEQKSRAPKLNTEKNHGGESPWENHDNSERQICLGYLLNNNRAKNTVDLSELPRDADLILEEHPGAFAAGVTPKIKHWQLHHCWDSAKPVLFGNPSLKQQPRLTLLSPGVWTGTFLLEVHNGVL